jgi:hypothetical protein
MFHPSFALSDPLPLGGKLASLTLQRGLASRNFVFPLLDALTGYPLPASPLCRSHRKIHAVSVFCVCRP